jgi:hypothetical protein
MGVLVCWFVGSKIDGCLGLLVDGCLGLFLVCWFVLLANYLFYKINDRWRAGIRFEWLRDDDGTLAGFTPTRPSAPGSYYNLTLGLNWHPRKHLRIRPEIRYDWQVRDSNAIAPAFDDGTSSKQWLIACDVLWEF